MVTAMQQQTQQSTTIATVGSFDAAQRQLIRDTFANGASDSEFAALMAVSERRKLDPFLKQIYFVQRWDQAKGRKVWATQVSIDGLRGIAERTGKYDGQDEPEFVEDAQGNPLVCKVKVYRKDWGRPAVGVAHWAEYVQLTKEGKPNSMWAKFKHVMLAKCAEALAMRKAFPEDTSGLYIAEEISSEPVEAKGERVDQPKSAPASGPPAKSETVEAEVVPAEPPTPEAPPAATGMPAFERLMLALDEAEAELDEEARRAVITAANRMKRSADLSPDEAEQVAAKALSVKQKIEAAANTRA